MSENIYTPPEGPPQGSAPALYLQLGMSGLYAFCEEQYKRLAASRIADLFPVDAEGLKEAAHKQAEFLAVIMGGPNLYILKHGPPRMRARHFDFTIDEASRQEWLRCFRETLGDGSGWGLTPGQTQTWREWTVAFSAWMVNREPPPPSQISTSIPGVS